MGRATASRLPVGAKAIAFPNGSVLAAISVRGPSARKALARRKGLGKRSYVELSAWIVDAGRDVHVADMSSCRLAFMRHWGGNGRRPLIGCGVSGRSILRAPEQCR